jgi:hypothetical protein
LRRSSMIASRCADVTTAAYIASPDTASQKATARYLRRPGPFPRAEVSDWSKGEAVKSLGRKHRQVCRSEGPFRVRLYHSGVGQTTVGVAPPPGIKSFQLATAQMRECAQ